MKARLDNSKEFQQAFSGACVRLLALSIAFFYSVLRTDWLKLIGSPSITAGVMLIIPATWLAIREHCAGTRLFGERRREVRLQPSAG